MSTVGIGLGLSFTTQTLPNGNIVPAVNAVDVNVDINRNDIDIKIWGNIWSDFASMFEVFFKSTVVQGIQDAVATTLTTTVPEFLNDFVAEQGGVNQIPTIDHWMLDWTTKEAAIVTETSFEIGATALMYDDRVGESEWSSAFIDMPYDVSESAQFQVFLSDLSVDSLMGSWLEVGAIEGTLLGDDIPYKNMTLTASMLDLPLPGFSAKYGADTIVDVFAKCTNLRNF